MTKAELREMIRECLHEELKANRLTEDHELFDLGRGYYADIDRDQYELHPERINVEIYKDTTGWQNPHYDKYITTVRSVDEAREYVADLHEELSESELEESTVQAENGTPDFLAIDGFEYSIEDTFEDDGYTGYEVIYSKDGRDIVRVELWEDGNYVTVIENLYAPNLMQRTYETFTQFAEDLEYKCDRYI